jgi:hypothetical protein
MPRGETVNSNTYIRMVTDLRKHSHKSNRNLVSACQYRAAHEFEDGSHHKMCLNIVTPSTLQSQSSILRFPCIWSPEGCNPWCEVWDYWQCDCVVKTWLHDWDKAWYQQCVHTFVLYQFKAVEVDGDFVKKTGYGVKPSLLIMCYFYDLGIKKIWVITLCRILHSICKLSQYIWFALCGCVYIIHHEDFLTVYYISVLMFCMCHLLYLCDWYCEILLTVGACWYVGICMCTNYKCHW